MTKTPAEPGSTAKAALRLTCTEPVDHATESLVRSLLDTWNPDLFGEGDVHLRPLLGGANNRNFIVECDAGKYALRVANAHADRLAVDRSSALQAQQDAAAAGIAPQVLAWQLPEGHQLSEFCEGAVLSPENLHDDAVLREVGRCLAELHTAPTTCRSFSPFEDIRSWTAVAVQDEIELSSEHLDLVDAAYKVEELVASLPLPVVFCHNDTVPQNFIRGAERISIVDWDYAGKGLACFELGSFACTADLDSEEVDGLLVGYGVTPTAPIRARMGLMAFVAAMREIAWALMAAPVLAGSTGVADSFYGDYLKANEARAMELQARWCTPEGFAVARQVDPACRV